MFATNTSPEFSIDSLLATEVFPHEVESIEKLETHISWVILAGQFAYKIKKPVKFDFVDYSTLKFRKAFCEKEVELNRRFASQIYLGVVPILQTKHGVTIGSEDDTAQDARSHAVEYAVKMKQFPQDAIVANMLDSPELNAARIDRFGKDLAGFHKHIERAPPDLPIVQPDQTQALAVDNFRTLISFFENDRRLDLIKQLSDWSDQQFDRLLQRMSQRLREGKIRRCHGDLHLKNVVYIDQRLVPFDGIEFNEGIQWNDVISEVAFPVMDLLARGRSDLGWRLLNAYLEESNDYDAIPLIASYLVYRSMVRAKVTALNPKNLSEDPTSDDLSGPWDKYLNVAKRIAFDSNPFLWITHGVSGSGKSTAALNAIEKSGGIRIRSDTIRHRLAKTFEAQEKYATDMNDAVYDRLRELAKDIIYSGLPVIVDATFIASGYRQAFRQLADEMNVPFGILNCEVTEDEAKRRILNRQNDASEATVTVLERQLQVMDPLTAEEQTFVVNKG